LKIAFVTPELEPLVHRTQLGKWCQSLATALHEGGTDLRVFLPHTRHADLEELTDQGTVGSVRVADVGGPTRLEITEGRLRGMTVYLLNHPTLFAERNTYGDEEGPYPDNWRRFALFARAVLASFEKCDFAPDLVHCADWTTGLLPLFRELEYVHKLPNHPVSQAGTFFQIQNLAMQGGFEREIVRKLGIPLRTFQRVDGIELAGKVNFLKAGCEFATILCTHSPGHALRIQEQDRGYGLEETFRRRSKELVGITNGIDYKAWDPENDALLTEPFSVKDKTLKGKRKCKAALQAMLNLDNGPRTPVAAMIGRFDADSGFDLAAQMLTSILERNVEVVLMGAGRKDILERLRTMEATFTGRCRVIEGYNPKIAHALMGGADFLLLPSHYTPGNALCAIGMRYGVMPVIYAGSGLEDYVIDLVKNPRGGTGVHFQNYTGDGLIEGIDAARRLYKSPTAWKAIVLRCLRQDFSWQATAAEYLKAYRRVTRRVRTSKKQKSA
jgi:starch synthase